MAALSVGRMGLRQGRVVVQDLEYPVGQRLLVYGAEQTPRVLGLACADDDDLQGLEKKVAAVEQCGEREEVLFDLAREGGDHRLGFGAVALPAGKEVEARQDPGHGAVARRYGAVVGALGPDDELCGIVRGQEVAAALAVPVVSVEDLDPGLGPSQVILPTRRLVKRERRPGHVGMVVERGRVLRLAVPPRMP